MSLIGSPKTRLSVFMAKRAEILEFGGLLFTYRPKEVIEGND